MLRPLSPATLLFKLAAVFVVLTLLLSACSAPKYLIGVDNPANPAELTAGVHLHKLFLSTSREKSADPAIYFSGERSTTMAFAQVTASIPPNHQVGKIELPKGKVPNPETDFLLVDPQIITSERDFISQLNRALVKRPRGNRDVLIFIHGYRNTLSDALMRAAQFVQDSGFEGVPIIFSWASRGKITGYVYDLNSALLARDDLSDLFALLEKTRATRYDILAHSMGNFLLIETIRQLRIEGKFDRLAKLNNIIMAAPDIDIDVFADTLTKLKPEDHNFYVLVSDKDRALKYARLVAGGVDRVGDANPKEVAALGVVAIDLSQVQDTSSLHHDTFAESPEVVQLIGRQMRETENFGVTPSSALVNIFADTKIAVFGG